MYLRDVVSKRKHGPDAVYVQLVEGYRDPGTGRVKTRILHSFGRKEDLDLDQIRRLVDQLLAYLPPEEQPDLPGGFDVTGTWAWGGPHLMDGLWRELELDRFFAAALRDRSFETDVERAIFTLLAQRALAPDSKLAAARWSGGTAWVPGLDSGGAELEVHHFYRAMDFLYEAMEELRDHLYFQVTDLLNADVSVIFYDTTSVSFEIDRADEEEDPDEDGESGLRRFGHSKKKRPDLPQVILAVAINRDGLPVRHWVFPGNTVDVSTVKRVTEDLAGLRPRRFLFVGDRGMVSQGNIDFLESKRRKYLLGCLLRDDDVVEHEVLSLRGRYKRVAEGVGVKETVIGDGDRPVRYLLCRDESRAAEDARVREELLARLEGELEGSRTATEHTRKACDLVSRPGYARYLTETEGGGLRIDRAAVRQDERLDGKYVLMTNDLDTPAEELVTGYRDMWRVERAFRSMKTALAMEPVYHRKRKRIISHAHLCVLAYLLIRLAENRTENSWKLVREELERISLSRIELGRTTVYRTKRLTGSEKKLWKRCRLAPPPDTLKIQ